MELHKNDFLNAIFGTEGFESMFYLLRSLHPSNSTTPVSMWTQFTDILTCENEERRN
jgi:hypothetical protein